jgi:hypothetical protein
LRSALKKWPEKKQHVKAAMAIKPKLNRIFRDTRMSPVAIIALTAILFFGAISPAGSAAPPPPEKCRQVLKQVLDAEDFGQKETAYRWERITEKKPASWLTRFFKGLIGLLRSIRDAINKWAGSMATLFEILMWMLLVGGGLWFIYRYTRISRLFSGSGAGSGRVNRPVQVLFGMAVAPESLPDDMAGKCRELLTEGNQRQALALLYRGTLSRLLNDYGMHVPGGATENECDRLVTVHRPAPEATFFSRLNTCWLDTAYGHRHLDLTTIGKLIDHWHQLYGSQK